LSKKRHEAQSSGIDGLVENPAPHKRAQAMSITQAVENENMLNEKTEYFLQKCGLSDILGASGACKESGLPVVKIARYPFALVFRSRSM
jgi:hypothetical protein